MKTFQEITNKKRTVKLVTGLNYYSKTQTFPFLLKFPQSFTSS